MKSKWVLGHKVVLCRYAMEKELEAQVALSVTDVFLLEDCHREANDINNKGPNCPSLLLL